MPKNNEKPNLEPEAVPFSDEHRAALDSQGWVETSIKEVLGLTAEEAAMVEIRFQLRQEFIQRRKATGMSQKQVATYMRSSQPRVAAMESGRESASLDFLLTAVFAVGMPPSEVGAVIARESEKAGVGMAK